MYCDLHNHLYGCLPAETLLRIGKSNPKPRWEIYLDSYEKAYGLKIRPQSFFEEYGRLEHFKSLYHFKEKSPFLHFQAKFNLIIALVQFHENEIREVTQDVVASHSLEDVSYAEYRLMFDKNESKEIFFSKLMATCEGLIRGEEQAKIHGKKITAKLAMSLHRDLNFEKHYDWMKNWMEKESIVKDKLVGIDFCHIEEGFRPRNKEIFFKQVLADNKAEPNTALSILYHVGESFRDKTPFSAVRWVIESANIGAHRLGHALALGVSPDYFRDEERIELVSERLDQINFELENFEKITSFGKYFEKLELDEERKDLMKKSPSEKITMLMDAKKISYLETFQNFGMSVIAKTNAVIECCPSSNLYIGMLETLNDHPISRFHANGLKITIGSDDPGLFDTNLSVEYERANQSGLDEKSLKEIQTLSFRYKSTVLSGREIVDL